MLTAWEAGASFVKVHPASLGGPKYFKDILAPLPQLKLVPSGGVTFENIGEFIANGARAVAMGGNLVDAKTVANRDWETITARAANSIQRVQLARAKKG